MLTLNFDKLQSKEYSLVEERLNNQFLLFRIHKTVNIYALAFFFFFFKVTVIDWYE